MVEPPFALGVNYAVAGADVDADMKYFKSIKRPGKQFVINIVLNNDKVPIPWAVGVSNNNGNFFHGLEVALKFARDPDFYVVYNIFYGPTTADGWEDARTAELQAAAYIQQFGLPIEISIHNEPTGSFGILYGISSLTQTGGVATLVAASAFKTHVGDTVTIYGSTRAQYNATHTVTNVINGNTFQFNIDPATVNPGNGSVYSLSVAQMNAKFRQHFTDMKAVYTAGKISIAEFNGLVNGVYSYDDWAQYGLGDADFFCAHVYPDYKGRPSYVQNIAGSVFSNQFIGLLNALGNTKVVIGETNISAGTLSGVAAEAAVTGARRLYTDLVSLGIKRAVIWSWNTNLAMRSNGIFSIVWGVFSTNNGRIPLNMIYKARPMATTRPLASNRPTAAGRPSI